MGVCYKLTTGYTAFSRRLTFVSYLIEEARFHEQRETIKVYSLIV